jgi:subtilisin family serine protease
MKRNSCWIDPQTAREAIKEGRGRGIKVAIIDSGIEISHPALRHLRLFDDIAFYKTPEGVVKRMPGGGLDAYGHGTAIASVINRAAPEAQLGSFRVLNEMLLSKYEIIEEGARLAVERGYHIINCSFGADARPDKITHFKSWIDYAYHKGVHIVSACNNANFRDPEWPGYFPSVITVNKANTLSDDLYFRWDNGPDGSVRHLVEFAARGMDLNLPWKNCRMVKNSGSSFAAPHVAGTLARLLSRYPHIKPPVAKALLQEVADDWKFEIRADNE